MDFVLLNRIGIILNFLAGFMLAPEVLGLERLKAIEETLEEKANNLHSYSNTALNNLERTMSSGDSYNRFEDYIYKILSPLSIITTIFILFQNTSVIIKCFLIANLFFYIGLIYFIISLFSTTKEELKRFPEFLFYILILSSPMIILYALMAAYHATYIMIYFHIPFILYIITRFIYNITKYAIRNLEKDDRRLENIIVWWGVIFFILGNLLQFIATF